MIRPALDIRLGAAGTTVRIEREPAITDHQWLQVRAEWGADGREANRVIDLPLERFMARRNAFARRCAALRIDVRLDDDIKASVSQAKETHQQLEDNRSAARSLSDEEVKDLLAASRFKRDLRRFQERDLARLVALPHGANFSVPGAGKTTVAFATYEIERVRGRVDRLLVIAPLSAFEAWKEEIEDCLDDPPGVTFYAGGKVAENAEILVTNYQRLAASYEALALWARQHHLMVLLDEAHRMKRGWKGEWGSACLNLAYLAKRRDILTGTPAPQSPTDLVALIDFLWPNEAIRILPPDALVTNPPVDSNKRVADAIRPLFVRTSKKDLDLPLVVKKPVMVPLEGLQKHIYEAMRDIYRGTFAMDRREELSLIAMGRVTMYLLEAATNPKLLSAGWLPGSDPEVFRHPPLEVPAGSHLAELIENYNLHETPRKFIELLRLVKANAELGRKTLVWSNFVRNLLALKKMLALYEPALIHGSVPPMSNDPTAVTRETEIKRFRGDPKCMVLLANPAAMSEGISLHHACHDAIYLDRTFNAGQYLQSVDRIHRLGLPPDQETRITFLLSEDTIDQVVDGRVRIKAERLAVMIGDPDLASVALPDEDDYGTAIDAVEDVAALFAHLRGENAR